LNVLEYERIIHCQGHDTTNSAIAFTLLNIAKRQDIQQKCFNEIRSVIGDDVNTPADMK
jgi:cytochrome P450 family 4